MNAIGATTGQLLKKKSKQMLSRNVVLIPHRERRASSNYKIVLELFGYECETDVYWKEIIERNKGFKFKICNQKIYLNVFTNWV